MRTFGWLFLCSLFLSSCNNNAKNPSSGNAQESNEPRYEYWIGQITIVDSVELPFYMSFHWDPEVNYDSTLHLYNGNQRVIIEEIEQKGDTTLYYLPVYPTVIKVVSTDTSMTGVWERLDVPNYRLPFSAKFVRTNEQPTSNVHHIWDHTVPNLPGDRWKVVFESDSEDPDYAIGEFKQEEFGDLTAAFARETGDYGGLTGSFDGESLILSSFDGTHAYVFKAKLENDTLKGYHYSGKGYAEPFYAVPSEDFELRDPTQLTFLKEGYETVRFTLPLPSGEEFTFNGKTANTPTIIQIMGSWCPNCRDESEYFRRLHRRYGERGLNIIGITFERWDDLESSRPSIEKMMTDLYIPYTIVFGGKATGQQISKVLPMIDNFMSYPTSIFIDREGNVRRIHTGFNGPTTEEYLPYTEETEALIEELLAE